MKIISRESADLIANNEVRIKQELKVLSIKTAQIEAKVLVRKLVLMEKKQYENIQQ